MSFNIGQIISDISSASKKAALEYSYNKDTSHIEGHRLADSKKQEPLVIDLIKCSDCNDNNLKLYSQKGILTDKTKTSDKDRNVFEDTKQAILSASAFRANIGVTEKKDEFLSVLLDI